VEQRRSTILLHSSLSQCGFIKNGPATILRTLRKQCDTLCVPTHTYCYPKPNGDIEIYDPSKTVSLVGSITNYFWRDWPASIRSIHPTHSLAAEGSLANELTLAHERCDTPCGKGSPYERLIDSDAAVVMFGTDLNTYTLFHTTEDAADCPYLYKAQPVRLKVKTYTGNLHEITMWRHDMTALRRFRQMDTILQKQDLLRRAPLGTGEVLFIPSARSVHEFLLARLKEDPWFLVAEDHRRKIGT